MEKPTVAQVLAEPAGRRLDAWVAEYVCGIKVLGEAWCWAPDGAWSVLPAKLQANYQDSGWTLRLVYNELGGEFEPDPDGDNLFGVPVYALMPVDEYSTDWAAAGPLLGTIRHQWSIGYDPGGWGEVKIFLPNPAEKDDECDPFRPVVVKFGYDGKTLPHAICRALVVAALEGRDGR